MKRQALRAIKWKIALLADGGGLLELVVVWTRVGLISIAGPASSTFAGVVRCIIGVVTTVTFRAPESCGDAIAVVLRLEEVQDMVLLRFGGANVQWFFH